MPTLAVGAVVDFLVAFRGRLIDRDVSLNIVKAAGEHNTVAMFAISWRIPTAEGFFNENIKFYSTHCYVVAKVYMVLYIM